MSIQTFLNLEPITPSEKEVEIARKSSRILANMSLKKTKSIDILLEDYVDFCVDRELFEQADNLNRLKNMIKQFQ